MISCTAACRPLKRQVISILFDSAHHRGVTKRKDGKVLLNSHVERVLVEDGRAVGVMLRGGGTIRATKAVVSNASVWDTMKLLPEAAVPDQVCDHMCDQVCGHMSG